VKAAVRASPSSGNSGTRNVHTTITTVIRPSMRSSRFVGARKTSRLSQAALETLAIVAYRQPISRGQISEIRGVSSDGVLRTLVARGVVEEVGRDPGPGQAILYGTTSLFLEKINLNSLSELPSLADLMPDSAAVERMESGLGPGL
jgi:segregation and condensation protein B